MNGPNATYGDQYWHGATQAAEDINAAGGINGEKIKLVQGDDACEPKQAVAVANRLVDQDKVKAVVGHFCSSSTMPASEVYSCRDPLHHPRLNEPAYYRAGHERYVPHVRT